MPMSRELCQKLAFPQMVTDNGDNHETAFSGIRGPHKHNHWHFSRRTRGSTRFCADADAKTEDFRRPGHIIPLMAKKTASWMPRPHRAYRGPDASGRS